MELLKTRGEDPDGKPLQTIVFVNAKLTARRLARELEKCGFNADAIHGDKTQEERLKLLKDFKDGTLNIMVATDVAARGLDIAELPLVINYDVPFVPEGLCSSNWQNRSRRKFGPGIDAGYRQR